jgi:hypothetical protein
VHYVSIQQFLCSKYQGIEEVVPRKLYKAWDRDNQAMVALKLVEVYGFEAASAWADHHVAVPSVLVRYACLVAASATKHCIFCHMFLVSPAAYWCATPAVVPSSMHINPMQNCVCRKLPGGFSLVSMPWLSKDQGWSTLSSLSATQMESDSVWPAIQDMLGRAHAPYSQ